MEEAKKQMQEGWIFFVHKLYRYKIRVRFKGFSMFIEHDAQRVSYDAREMIDCR